MIPCTSAENITIENNTLIQDSVNNVSNDETIYLTPGVYKESAIKIDKNITLQGLGDAKDIIIDGENKNSIVLINSRSKVTIKNITFINGNSPDYGGGIHVELGGSIYVDNCNFINNSATVNGGAIDICGKYHVDPKKYKKAYLNATNCNFINNSASHDGGAIATNYGESYIYNSTFKYNYADRDGGAIRVALISTTLTENCTFEENVANEWGGAFYNWLGGLTVNNCTVNNNTAGTRGGAIFNAGKLIADNSTITNNRAEIGGVLYIHEEVPQVKPTVKFNFNEVDGNKADIASLVYARQINPSQSDFNNNNWGDINPNSTNWNSEFISNGFFSNPTMWIEKHESIPDFNENSSYSNTSANISKDSFFKNNDTQESFLNQFKNRNTTEINSDILTNSTSISEKVSDDSENLIGIFNNQPESTGEKTSEIFKKEVSKHIFPDLSYLAIIPFILILIFGFYNEKRKR